MDDIRKAEQVSTQRAVIFYLLAAVLVLGLIVTGDQRDPVRLLPWLATIALGAANLVTVGLMRSRRLRALIDDESTKLHRTLALTSGFWAALVTGLLTSVLATTLPITAVLAARVIVTAAIVAALVCFATLELRAAQ